jgi:hypothetical protein
MLGVVQIEARYAGRDPVRGAIPTERPSCRRDIRMMWSAHAVDNPKQSDRSAEHGVAADRFAREIVGFLVHSLGRARGS